MAQIVRRARGSYRVTERIVAAELWNRMMHPFTAGAEFSGRATWIDMMFPCLEPQDDGTFIGRGTTGGLYPIKVLSKEPGRYLSYRWGKSLNPPPITDSDTVDYVHADYSYTIVEIGPGLLVEGEYTAIFWRLRPRSLRMKIFGQKEFEFPPSERFRNVLGRIPAKGRLEFVQDLD